MPMQRIAVGMLSASLAAALAQTGPPTYAQAPQAVAAQATADAGLAAPFPDVEVYRVQVYGDSLADGLIGGLSEALAGEPRVQLQRRNRSLQGLLRGDPDEEARQVEAEIGREPPHIAVIMLGINDRLPFRLTTTGQRINVGQDMWRAEYGRRIDRLTRIFRRKAIAVYWVGLPIMRRQDITDDMQMMGGVMRERALVNNARFIDVLTTFAEADGSYSAYGPDVAGKSRLLREQDGIHFTQAGYRKLAHFVERELRRDIAQARQERAVPLAGSEEEQRRIRPVKAAAVPGAAPPGKGGPAPRPLAPGERTASRPVDGSARDVRPDNSRVVLKGDGGSEVALEILRPAIPASVVALVTRRESADRASQVGDPVMTEIPGGLTIVSTVTPSGEAQPGDRRRQSSTSSLYFRVLVKGERLEPRPGRSDHFPWPREEVLPPAPPPPPRTEPAVQQQRPAPPAQQQQRPAQRQQQPRNQ